MRLRSKFLLSIGVVITIAFGFTYYLTSRAQYELVVSQTERAARMLASQIILTRKWVADHNGLFLVKGPGVVSNPFLAQSEIRDQQGTIYVKRNPAMVTRELSEYATNSNFWTFRVTSLKPVNPANAPDSFESKGLKLLEGGQKEVVAIEQRRRGRVLRFLTPLVVEKSCLECHARQGYAVGDIRGALSLSIPMTWADHLIARNNRLIALVVFLTIVGVGVLIFSLMNSIVVRRLSRLSRVMERYPEEQYLPDLTGSSDEIGQLSRKFEALAHHLKISQGELEKTRELVYQAEKMAALGRLSAGIAHEVNNPLGGMLNCVKSMKRAPENRDLQARYLELLEKGLRRLEKTMRQLLNFGRRESLTLNAIEIDQLVEECLGLMEYRLKGSELQRDLQMPGSYLFDADALRQVVVNIVLNAIDALPKSGGRLTVSTARVGEEAVISIKDNGEGIRPEDLRHIFEPFYTTREVGKGTGLGLSVSFALVERMNGRIEVESKLGEGSQFRIVLPLKTATVH